MENIFVVIGLGNFPLEYLRKRHNAGFMVLDALQEELGFEDFKIEGKFQCDVTRGMVGDKKVLLGKPQTYMNKSGYSVAEILNFYKIPPKNLIVVYDDVALKLGEVRHREKGSAGTHNGMRDIVDSLGTEEFQRVRVGIENRDEEMIKKQDLTDYVLGNFAKDEEDARDQAIKEAISVIKGLLSD